MSADEPSIVPMREAKATSVSIVYGQVGSVSIRSMESVTDERAQPWVPSAATKRTSTGNSKSTDMRLRVLPSIAMTDCDVMRAAPEKSADM